MRVLLSPRIVFDESMLLARKSLLLPLLQRLEIVSPWVVQRFALEKMVSAKRGLSFRGKLGTCHQNNPMNLPLFYKMGDEQMKPHQTHRQTHSLVFQWSIPTPFCLSILQIQFPFGKHWSDLVAYRSDLPHASI